MGSSVGSLGAGRFWPVAWRWPLAFLLWLAPSTAQLIKLLHKPGAVLAAAVAAVGIAAALAWAQAPGRPGRREPPWHMLIGVALCLAFALAYPIATSGLVGGGSDRADALDVTGAALLRGQPIYEAMTYRGAPPTPMPGAVLLALPFHLIGSAALQNVVWFLVFCALAPRLIGDRRGASAYLGIFVLLCPGVLVDFATGSDFATNAVYVIVAVWALTSLAPVEGWPVRLLAAALFALALSSRPIYVVEAPIATAALLQRQGLRRCLETMGAVALLLAAINLPILADEPSRFPVLLHAGQLWMLPNWMHATVLLPALAMLIACAAFLVRLEGGRIWLISAISLAAMILPPFLVVTLMTPMRAELGVMDSYIEPLALFAGLWLMRPARSPPPAALEAAALAQA